MLLSLFHLPVTVELLGETEASSAGEQTAEGYPAGAHRDDGLVVGSSIPTTTFAPPHRIDRPLHAFLNSRPKGGTNSEWASVEVAIFSGTKWPYFPEPARARTGRRIACKIVSNRSWRSGCIFR
jgi:hypothetical protein